MNLSGFGVFVVGLLIAAGFLLENLKTVLIVGAVIFALVIVLPFSIGVFRGRK